MTSDGLYVKGCGGCGCFMTVLLAAFLIGVFVGHLR